MEIDFFNNIKILLLKRQFKEFERWRNDNINIVNDYYKSLEYPEDLQTKEVKKQFWIFNKCMKQFTRQLCKCDNNCFSNSVKFVDFKEKFIDKDLKLEFISNDFGDCSNFGMTVINGEMYLSDDIKPYDNIKLSMIDIMNKICEEDFGSFPNLQCVVLEIQEFCKKDLECIQEFVIPNIPDNCKFVESKIQLNLIKDLFGISFVNQTDNSNVISRSRRSIDAKYIEDDIPNVISRSTRSIDAKYIEDDIFSVILKSTRSIDDVPNVILESTRSIDAKYIEDDITNILRSTRSIDDSQYIENEILEMIDQPKYNIESELELHDDLSIKQLFGISVCFFIFGYFIHKFIHKMYKKNDKLKIENENNKV